MKAVPGDRIVMAPVIVESPIRDGEVLEARGPDGGEPFLVRWSDGHIGLLYPGPGSVLRIGPASPTEEAIESGGPAARATTATSTAAQAQGFHHVHDWQVRISIFDSEEDAEAQVVLLADSPTQLTARGHSRRGADASDIPEIRDELAVARALRRLADRLLETAAADLKEVTQRPAVTLRPR